MRGEIKLIHTVQKNEFAYQDFKGRILAHSGGDVFVLALELVMDESGNIRYVKGSKFWIDTINYQLKEVES